MGAGGLMRLRHDDEVKIARAFRAQLPFGVPFLGAACVAIGLGLPFVAVGKSRRSAYALVRSARNLNLLEGPLRVVLGSAVVLVPMLTGALLICFGLGYRRIAVWLGVGIGLLGLAAALSTLLVSTSSFLHVGPILTLSGGIVSVSWELFQRWATSKRTSNSNRTSKRKGSDHDGLYK